MTDKHPYHELCWQCQGELNRCTDINTIVYRSSQRRPFIPTTVTTGKKMAVHWATEHRRERPAVILNNSPPENEPPMHRQCDQLHPNMETEVLAGEARTGYLDFRTPKRVEHRQSRMALHDYMNVFVRSASKHHTTAYYLLNFLKILVLVVVSCTEYR